MSTELWVSGPSVSQQVKNGFQLEYNGRLTEENLGTISDGRLVPTVTDTAFNLGLIDAHQLGIFFQPTNQAEADNGELTFGGVDASKIVGGLRFVYVTLSP